MSRFTIDRVAIYPYSLDALGAPLVLLLKRAASADLAGAWEPLSVALSDGGETFDATAWRALTAAKLQVLELLRLACETSLSHDGTMIRAVPSYAASMQGRKTPHLTVTIHTDFEWVPLAEARARVWFAHQRLSLDELNAMLQNGFPSQRARLVLEPG